MADGERDFWTAREFFKYLGVAECTGYGALQRGEVAGAVQIGKVWRIFKREFFSSLKAEEQQTGKG